MATCGTLGGMYARRWLQQNGPAGLTESTGTTEGEFE